MSGDIAGNSKTPLTFTYKPTSFTTAEAEYEIRTSEFDFEPQVIRIIGNAVPQKVDIRADMFYNGQQEGAEETELGGYEENSQVIRRKNRTLLTDKSTRSARNGDAQLAPGQTLAKIPESSFKKKTNK